VCVRVFVCMCLYVRVCYCLNERLCGVVWCGEVCVVCMCVCTCGDGGVSCCGVCGVVCV